MEDVKEGNVKSQPDTHTSREVCDLDLKQLHGEWDMARRASKDVNESEFYGDLGAEARANKSLDYIHAGDIAERLAEHKRDNPEIIDLKNPYDLYPGVS